MTTLDGRELPPFVVNESHKAPTIVSEDVIVPDRPRHSQYGPDRGQRDMSIRIQILAVPAFLLVACAGPGADGSDGSESDTSGESESDSHGTDAGEEDTDDWGEEDTDDWGEEDGGDCEWTDCGEGECHQVGNDVYCECPPGTSGLGCLPCPTADEVLEVDVRTVTVAGDITINGQVPPADEDDAGEIWLVNPFDGDEVFLGSTADGRYEGQVVPGPYYIEYRSDGAFHETAPVNTHYRIGFGKIVGPDAQFGPIDLRPAYVTVDFQLDGGAPPADSNDDGLLTLVLTDFWATPESHAPIGLTSIDRPAVPVLPGQYAVAYSVDSAGPFMPRNSWVVFHAELEVEPYEADEAPVVRNFQTDMSTAVVDTSTFGLDGIAFPADEEDDGVLTLVRDGDTIDTSDTIDLGKTSDPPDSVPVSLGIYLATYRTDSDGPNTPLNTDLPVAEFEAGSMGIQYLNTASLELVVLLDGEPLPDDLTDIGEIWLVNQDRPSDTFLLGSVADGFDDRVGVGNYDVVYRSTSSEGELPSNDGTVVDELQLAGDMVHEVSIDTVYVDGEFTINGEAPPGDEASTATIILENLDRGGQVILGQTHQQVYGKHIIPGLYAVYYSAAGPDAAINDLAPVVQVEILGDVTWDFDLPIRSLERIVTLDGGPPPGQAGDSGVLTLKNETDSASLGTTTQPSIIVDVLPGGYDVRYSSNGVGATMPRNQDATVACFNIE